ncbi:MAG: hypothetical protein H0U12_07730, partial [Thermoleophilaceae bacterium]|nr:hypothetical protein [Thermoleophilaceae bacterium]
MNFSSSLHGLTRPALALVAGALCAAVAAAPALAQGPGLPLNYDVQRIDTPHPEGSDPEGTDPEKTAAPNFGWGVTSANLNDDPARELLVAQSQSNFDGEIHIFDGTSRQKIDTITPPEGEGLGVELAFIYVETMPDIGRCTGGSAKICGAIGGTDGIPEILAGSRALTVDADGDAIGHPDFQGPGKKVGRAYVFDGKTRKVLKKIDMPPLERAAQPDAQPDVGGANFGRLVMSPSGLPACKGSPQEGHDAGRADCPSELDLPPKVRRGSVDDDDIPDIVVTARNYQQSRDSVAARAPTSECAVKVAPGKNCTTGRAWIYSGKNITGDPNTPLNEPYRTIDNPMPQANSQEFGGNVFRVGDTTGDKLPDFVIAARSTDYPIAAPDPDSGKDAGAGFLVDPSKPQGLSVVRNYTSPEPQPGAQFAWSFNSGPAPGDLDSTGFPDLFLPSPGQNRFRVDDGSGFALSGSNSRHFGTVNDPTPAIGGEFGASQAGVGDLVPGADKPANELLVGGVGPYTLQNDETARL